MVGKKAPSDYLEQLQTHKSVGLDDAAMDKILDTHFIEPKDLRLDDFDGFIESRRALLIGQVSLAMGKPVASSGEAVADDGDMDEEEGEE
ncbi:MAG: hypothetical protein KF691_00885 [Phycisphaeraceae bacterium]|nr:hypothetical protein [Phycisphaeraceae bacterium]